MNGSVTRAWTTGVTTRVGSGCERGAGTAAGSDLGIRRWILTLLGDVEPIGSVGILVLASEELSEDGIVSDGGRTTPRGLWLGGCG
jgi:hypothetical protein